MFWDMTLWTLSASWKKVQPPPAGWKNKQSRQEEISSEGGNCMIIQNVCGLLWD
jgi:hypothetical protein